MSWQGAWLESRQSPQGLLQAQQAPLARPLEVRSPGATRCWLHVLDCLAGYLQLGKQLYQGRSEFADAWNLGSSSEDNQTVDGVLNMLRTTWPNLQWCTPEETSPHETGHLHLESARARSLLKWKPVWDLKCALAATAAWYEGFTTFNVPLTDVQLKGYVESAVRAGCSWAVQ